MTLEATQPILALNAFDRRAAAALAPETALEIERRHHLFGARSLLAYEVPIHMAQARGVWMTASDGTRYLDAYNNVPSVGHCHPRVVAAVADQAARLATNTRYLYDVLHRYAERLLATMPPGIDNLVMTCTGSESNDLAFQIATAATGRQGFVVTDWAYHGNTGRTAELSPSSIPGRAPPPHVEAIAVDDLLGDPAADAGERLAARMRDAIRRLEERGVGLAGFMIDTILSSDGIYADPPGFLGPAAAAVRQAGGLLVADEVQPGFGRTGAGLWGFARHGLVPDIVTLGKPMGNGFPVGAVVLRSDLLRAFTDDVGYFNTFGGNPVAAAAALAVLEVIFEEALVENARTVGGHLLEGLRSLEARHEAIRAVRGVGLYVGLELRAGEIATRVINGMRRRRVLIGAAGKAGQVLKIRPPLVFSRADADLFVTALDDALAELAASC